MSTVQQLKSEKSEKKGKDNRPANKYTPVLKENINATVLLQTVRVP